MKCVGKVNYIKIIYKYNISNDPKIMGSVVLSVDETLDEHYFQTTCIGLGEYQQSATCRGTWSFST